MHNNLFKKAYNIFKEYGMEGLIYRTRRALANFVIPVKPDLVSKDTHGESDRIAKQCREILNARPKKQYDKKAYELLMQHNPWYQRIDLPAYNLSTMYEEKWAVFDDAPDNTLGGRLSSREAAMLRPQPKWMFIKSRLPQIKDKSILEIGSNCGFFSFEFARIGAKDVTGMEAIAEYVRQACLIKDLLKLDNVRFINKDFLFQQELPKYDIVFSSAVLGHMVFPFFGLYKMLQSAREFVVLDIDILPSENLLFDAVCRLYLSNKNRYHFFNFSNAMITNFLYRCGIKEINISRHFYADRCLYIISVSSEELKAALDSANDPLWSMMDKSYER